MNVEQYYESGVSCGCNTFTTTRMVCRFGLILLVAVVVLASGELPLLSTSGLSCNVDGRTLDDNGVHFSPIAVSVIMLGVDVPHSYGFAIRNAHHMPTIQCLCFRWPKFRQT